MKSTCRFCKSPLDNCVVDLGLSPISNDFRKADTVNSKGQMFYPLEVRVCDECWLVQLTDVETAPHFTDDYAYFSSLSSSWLEHSRQYAEAMISRLSLDSNSLVVELASNDGYLLQYFKTSGVPVLGIEPTQNTAEVALARHGIKSIVEFFGHALAKSLKNGGVQADLIAGNNVLAHVPDINDFVSGVPILLKPNGTVTFEFPHLLKMLRFCQFDTIYHEHFSYLSLLAVEQIFAAHGLEIYGVEEIPTHGGSLRVYASHKGNGAVDNVLRAGLEKVRNDEASVGLHQLDTYLSFGCQVVQRKVELLAFLIEAKRAGKSVLAYGAPAKGNTMLNFCGIGPELVSYTTDRSPQKIGKYLPGTNLPVRTIDELIQDRPDYILILPWNLRDEISEQLLEARDWGAKFVVAIPEVEIF